MRAVKENFKKIYHDNKEKDPIILKDIFNLPFQFKDHNITNFDSLCNKYNEEYELFLNYFKNQWYIYFKNGMLNYSYIKKKYRSNSYIEYYNKIVKLKLSKYLFGKSKSKISWPLFLYFIRNEEEEYRKELIKYDNSIEKKLESNIEENNNINKNEKLNIPPIMKENRKWLKFNQFSCRYDSFFLFYTFIIKLHYFKHNINLNHNIPELYDLISEEILNCDEKKLEEGIWIIIQKYVKNYPFLQNGFQEYYTINQLFDKFENIESFCFKYSCIEGCSNCIPSKESIKYLSPVISCYHL